MSAARVEEYLSAQKNGAKPENVEDWRKLEELYSKSLWHPLVQHLKLCIKDPKKSFKKRLDLLQLYEVFIRDFEHRVNPYTLMEILVAIADALANVDKGVEFLEKAQTRIAKNNDEALILCLTGIAGLKLIDKPNAASPCVHIKQVRSLLEEAESKLGNLSGVTPVHAQYYRVSSIYLREMGQYGKYYREALRYLGCTDLTTVPAEDLQTQAVCLGLAALLGEDVYNFGELLAHPVLKSLNSADYKWLKDLLFAFNRGDLKALQALKPYWSKIDDLSKRESDLNDKIKLLCLMEIAFARDAKSRQIPFSEISEQAQVPLRNVEQLVMRAMSLGLVKGTIDQVTDVVNITWVQPRVLDLKQIDGMQKRMCAWSEAVSGMADVVRDRGQEILTQ